MWQQQLGLIFNLGVEMGITDVSREHGLDQVVRQGYVRDLGVCGARLLVSYGTSVLVTSHWSLVIGLWSLVTGHW